MKYRPTAPFWEAYSRLSPTAKRKARRAFRLFQQGAESPPFHPSLRIRKMMGHPTVWEEHISRQYVFTFHIERDPATEEIVYVFRNIGTHEIYRQP